MIIGFILIVMSQKISTGDIRTYQVNCFLLLHNTWVYYGIIQDECSLYLSLPARFSIFLIPGNGGLWLSIRAIYWWAYDHIYTCYPRLTNCHHRHKLEYIFSDSEYHLFVCSDTICLSTLSSLLSTLQSH